MAEHWPVGDPAPLPTAEDLLSFSELMDVGVVLLADDSRLLFANTAAWRFAGDNGDVDAGRRLLELMPPEALSSARAGGSWSGEITVPGAERRLTTSIYHRAPVQGAHFFCLLRDVTDAYAREQELQRRHAELRQTYVRLAGAQEQLLQSEKMASIGQLAAGVAHEINNPIGYVHSNLGTLQDYIRSLLTLIEAYDRALRSPAPAGALAEIDDMRARFDLDFLLRDLPQLLAESREGIERVTKIVQDLKDFSYSGRNEPWKQVDLHKGLDSTLNIVWNELKYKARLEKRYGNLPLVECLPSELNQVFMNILLNAGQAIRKRGTITLASGVEGEEVWISVADTGDGIPEDVLPRIFDPFYTTKPVGRGTGLGLSISYGIVVKHHGRIDVQSRPGQGSTFKIVLPIRQPPGETADSP